MLLEEAKVLSQSDKDCWDELADEDKNLLMESEAQYERVMLLAMKN